MAAIRSTMSGCMGGDEETVMMRPLRRNRDGLFHVIEMGGNMKIRCHRDLDVWQRGVDMVAEIYQLTNSWPASERYGLTTQLRRAAVSVPSNIAEGSARSSSADFSRFLDIAKGSLAEIETQLEIAKRIGLIDSYSVLENQLISLRRMLVGLQYYVRQKKH
jgi:four helix bundle protein